MTQLNLINFGKALLVKDYFEKTLLHSQDYGENTIVLMQVGAFFEVYGLRHNADNLIKYSNILDFSRICDLNMVDKNICVGNDKEYTVMMAGFKDMVLDRYLKKLQEAGYSIAVYTQDETGTNRTLCGIFSPGTFFSQDSAQITNNTLCIWISVVEYSLTFLGKLTQSKKNNGQSKRVYVGVANINIYTGKSTIFEFNEIYLNSPTTFDDLERFVSIYNPNEVVIIANLPAKEIDDIISYADIKCGKIHVVNLLEKSNNVNRAFNCEKQIYQKELLGKIFKINDFDVFIQNFNNNVIATQAYCYLLDFIYQHNPKLIHNIEEPMFEHLGDRLTLANHSLKQLNIIDDTNSTGNYSSVLKILNKCITPMGKRKFAYLFLNPTLNENKLNAEYNITDHILSNYNYNDVKIILQNIRDISKINRQIVLKKISPKSIAQLYTNLHIIKDLYRKIEHDSTIISYLQSNMSDITNLILFTDALIQFLDTNLDLKQCEEIDTFQNFEINFIKRGINSELDNENQILIDSNDKIECCRNYFNNIIADCEKKTKTTEYVKLHETEKNNFNLIATDRRCKLLKSSFKTDTVNLSYNSSYNNIETSFELNVSGIEFIKQSTSNNAITTPQINALCKNITHSKLKMKDIILKVYLTIIKTLEDYQSNFDCIVNFVTYIDVIYTKAFLAKKYNYCKPVIVEADKSFVDIEDLRHCLIEHIQQNELYVANDIHLGNKNVNGILLYGTNAVGKTSLIRALGISVIMAQSGLYVPASSFKYKPYKYIFTRILGNDNIFKGLSTFAVEMSELRSILRLSEQNSLILGDELCSGTESISATSIFVAGIKQLHERNASFIFATHLHEITKYEEITNLENLACKHMSVFYDNAKDLLIYDRKLRDGQGDNMYGLEVCKSLNLPADFLELAHTIRMKYHPESASVLSLKTTHFNSKKIKGVCEKCNTEIGAEIHHLQHQSRANEDGIIKSKGLSFHKNHPANLMTLCHNCHEEYHDDETNHRRVKTSDGWKVYKM